MFALSDYQAATDADLWERQAACAKRIRHAGSTEVSITVRMGFYCSTFESMTDKHLPSQKIAALLQTAQSIFKLLNKSVSTGELKASSCRMIFFHFIFVVAAALPCTGAISCQYMWELCNPKLLAGEGGYYLTVFESAVHYISNWKDDAESVSSLELSAAHDATETVQSSSAGSSDSEIDDDLDAGLGDEEEII